MASGLRFNDDDLEAIRDALDNLYRHTPQIRRIVSRINEHLGDRDYETETESWDETLMDGLEND